MAQSIRRTLQTRFIIALFAGLLVSFLISIVMASRSSRVEQERHLNALIGTIGTLLEPSIAMSDYMETQRLLKLIDDRSGVTSMIITRQGDYLLSNYASLDIFRTILKPSVAPDCLKVNSTEVVFNQRRYMFFCKDIYESVDLKEHPARLATVLSMKPAESFHFELFTLLSWITCLGIVLVGAYILLGIFVQKYLVRPLENLDNRILDAETDPFSYKQKPLPKITPMEIVRIEDSFFRLLQSFLVESKRRAEFEKKETVFAIARQVVHDIRSPLSALDIVLATADTLPEKKRLLARSAITRIKDIANGLLFTNRDPSSSQLEFNPSKELRLIPSLVDDLISEKRTQYRNLLNVEIVYDQDSKSYGLFADIYPTELKRVLSNLINNSVEALFEKPGKVAISIRSDQENLIIEVTDNGKGIPADILPKLGQEGVSFGKKGTESGSGLGLYHARKTIESMNGSLEIESTENLGTTVRISLPRSKAPEWFVPKLELDENARLVIVDDDTSILDIWRDRLSSLNIDKYKIEVFNFLSVDKFVEWQKSRYLSQTVFLIDYEFMGSKTNGLKAISELRIEKSAILMTNRYEDPQVIKRVNDLGIRMIPKPMATILPIIIKKEEQLQTRDLPPTI